MSGDLPLAGWKDRVWFILRRRTAFVVAGNSMSPTLTDGDIVIINPKAPITKGDIVLALHPYKQSVRLIKRVTEITATGAIVVIGDNPAESTDSRTIGNLPPENIVGKVICRLK